MIFPEQERERIEIEFWRTSEHQSPGATSLDAIINKVKDAEVFLDLLGRYRNYFPKNGRILELGAGHGWASCLVKRNFPNSHVIATDISQYALESVHRWQPIFGASPDEVYACNSYATREPDHSIDMAFCFASAHHFSNQQRTLIELARILKSEGVCIYFYEPTCERWLYPIALKRVNAKRPHVPEDLLVPSRLRQQARTAQLAVRVDYDPSIIRRSFAAGAYYRVLRKARVLQHVLPCCANIVISNKDSAGD